MTWHETYDRGVRTKPGQIQQGSGTTPTLMGTRFITITDNADPQMHVLVYRRGEKISKPRLVCEVPVLTARQRNGKFTDCDEPFDQRGK